MGPRGDVILEADWCVSEFLKELDCLGLSENTIVVFSSDNGPVLDDGYKDQAKELLGEHKMAGPLRGGKTSLYSAGTCVPFMIRWPAIIEPAVSDATVCQMDLLASFSALIGETYDDRLDSQNTLSAFLGKSNKGRYELVTEGMFNYAFRQGDWVLIPAYPDAAGKRGYANSNQLFHVKTDIGQKNNVADENLQVVRKMMMRFEHLKRVTSKVTDF